MGNQETKEKKKERQKRNKEIVLHVDFVVGKVGDGPRPVLAADQGGALCDRDAPGGAQVSQQERQSVAGRRRCGEAERRSELVLGQQLEHGQRFQRGRSQHVVLRQLGRCRVLARKVVLLSSPCKYIYIYFFK